VSKPIIYIPLNLDDKFNVAFPNKRVPNGFIDKTKTRLGITYTNFHDERHSISVLPSVPIIEDALIDYPYLELFSIYDKEKKEDKVTVDKIAEYLLSNAEYKRIVVTPESFIKIIRAAQSIGRLQWLYDNFFLYLDEVHCYATEAFRKDILGPFDNDYVWKFANMAMGSATPFRFSDPRVKGLQHYKITFGEKFGKINIINHAQPLAVLAHMLTHSDMFPGNSHIFFNSVTGAGDFIRLTGIDDVNIYCRDDERNMINLQEAKIFFKETPVKEEYKKFNFYSCRYNEGWDLKDDKTATIILLTDVHKPQTLIGIPYKGYQAVGRMKVTPNKIYHITNNLGKPGMRTFDEIHKKCVYNATKQIDFYNQHKADCHKDNIEDDGKLQELITPFAKFDGETAEISIYKHDQLICEEYCKEHYNNVDSIRQTWESLNYETEQKNLFLLPVVKDRKSQEAVNREIIEQLEDWKRNPSQYEYGITEATIAKYQLDFQLLYEAYSVLGLEKIKELEYNDKAMKTALINYSNENAQAKLHLMLIDEFKLNERYTTQYIKSKLQECYNLCGIKKPNGNNEVATASKLNDLGLFELYACKIPNSSGKPDNGYEVIRINFDYRQAA
jgi:hypothetical protein